MLIQQEQRILMKKNVFSVHLGESTGNLMWPEASRFSEAVCR